MDDNIPESLQFKNFAGEVFDSLKIDNGIRCLIMTINILDRFKDHNQMNISAISKLLS